MTDLPEHPTPRGVTIYYWPCSLVLLAPSLILDRPTGPLSATVRIACKEPYTIEVGEQKLVTRASIVAPKAERRRILAQNSDIALFYLPLDTPEYSGVRTWLGDRTLVDLPLEPFAHLLPDIRRAMTEVVQPSEIKQLVQHVVEAITDRPMDSIPEDPRVRAAREVLDQMPLSEVRLESVAQRVHLSASRLRDLFRKHTGFTIGEYARWRAVWRAALLWKRGLTITQVAEEAGFHDLAHADRAFNQVFGVNPSTIIDPRFVTLVNCE